MVDFSVLPEASPASEVYPDTRAVRVRVPELDNGIKLFPFYRHEKGGQQHKMKALA